MIIPLNNAFIIRLYLFIIIILRSLKCSDWWIYVSSGISLDNMLVRKGVKQGCWLAQMFLFCKVIGLTMLILHSLIWLYITDLLFTLTVQMLRSIYVEINAGTYGVEWSVKLVRFYLTKVFLI